MGAAAPRRHNEAGSQYVQCVVTRNNEQRTTWLPAKFAIPGRIVKLRDDGVWSDGWQVTEVGSRTYLSDLDAHREIKAHRRSTGDAEKKE